MESRRTKPKRTAAGNSARGGADMPRRGWASRAGALTWRNGVRRRRRWGISRGSTTTCSGRCSRGGRRAGGLLSRRTRSGSR
eukprot:7545579-Pyramimonas_sp.AAC.2